MLTPAPKRLQSELAAPARFSPDDMEVALARIADRPEMIVWLPTVEFWQQYNQDTYAFTVGQARDLRASLQAELERLQ